MQTSVLPRASNLHLMCLSRAITRYSPLGRPVSLTYEFTLFLLLSIKELYIREEKGNIAFGYMMYS